MDEVMIVAERVSDLPPDCIAFGSVQRPCSKCQVPVWLAPSSIGILERGEAKGVICIVCVSPSEVSAVAIAPDTAREVIEHLARRHRN